MTRGGIGHNLGAGMVGQPGEMTRPAPQPRYANWPLRVVAFAVDGLVFWVLPILGFIVVNALHLVDEQGNPSGAGNAIFGVATLAGFALAIANIIVWQGLTGRTAGKALIRARLVSLDSGHPLGILLTFVRQLCHIVNALPCYLGYLWPLWDPRSQTFADKIVRSVVVRD